MSSSELDVLKQHRDALLLAEVGAWLHMLGKFSGDFLGGNHDLATDMPPDLQSNYPQLYSLLKDPWPGPIWARMPVPEFEANGLSFFDLIQHHHHQNRKAPEGFLRLMQDAHGRASGIEKGVLDRFADKQSGAVYPATVVGIEREAIDLSDLENRRKALYEYLQEQLQLLRDRQAEVDWAAFRGPFIKRLEQDFRFTVAETRRPLNDVTLFDQTMVSVALFKASLAQSILIGWTEPNVEEIAKKYHWRILRLGIDGLTYWGQAARANDLLSRKALIKPALDKVQELLEATHSLGMEIYRDENGSLSIMPDIPDLLEYCADGQTLREHINSIADLSFVGEARFNLIMSEHTRNTLLFGQLAASQLFPPVPLPATAESWWMGVSEDICPVCGLRPQGPSRKAMERKVCDCCENRRTERAAEWLDNLQTTIWIDEVADTNGRATLIIGRFGLESWLRGEAFNTVLAFEPSNRLLQDEKRSNKQYQFDYDTLLEQIALAQKSKQKLGKWVPLLDDLLLPGRRGRYEYFSDIYRFYVGDTDLDGSQDPWRFALSLMRQQPAFARLRRLWEITRCFWKSELDELTTGDYPLLQRVGGRLIIRAADLAQLNLGPYHAYELHLGPTTLAVVYQNGELITVDNLRRIAKVLGAKQAIHTNSSMAAGFVKQYLEQQGECAIEQPNEYGRSKKTGDQIQIVQVLIEKMSYQPLIPVLAEPRTMMAIVPADKAVEIALTIQDQYHQYFDKVCNRLPLFLGLVFFQRKTPLAAVMDAGRRMMEQTTLREEKTWQISQDVTDGSLHFTNGLTWDVPNTMRDGSPDCWYPYFYVEGDPGPRPRRFQYNGRWLVHIDDLGKDDRVYVTPSRFAYLFLEHTAQRFRFDPQKDILLLDELPRLAEMWDTLKCKTPEMTDTKLQGIRNFFDAKWRLWRLDEAEADDIAERRKAFRRLVQTTFVREHITGIDLEEVLNGRFQRCLDIYLHILKRRIKEAQN